MRDSIWTAGAERLTGDDVKKKREDVRKRLKRKRDLKRSTEKLLLAQNEEQEFKKEMNIDAPCWNQFIMNCFPNYYS